MSLSVYVIQSEHGYRVWHAEDADHAIEQHADAFPDEPVLGVAIAVKAQWGDGALPGVTSPSAEPTCGSCGKPAQKVCSCGCGAAACKRCIRAGRIG